MSNKLIVTPIGEALYPHLYEPDYKFNQGGLYQTRLVLEESDYNEVKAEYDAFYEKAYSDESEKAGKPLKKDDTTPFREGEEGLYILAKQVAQRQTRDKGTINFKIAAINAQGKRINMPQVGTGSKLRLALEPHAWAVNGKFGVSLRLRSVQIVDLVEYGSKDSVFGTVEGGFDGGEDFTNELNEETPSKADGDFSF